MASSNSGLMPSIPPPAGEQPNFTHPECDQHADYIILSLSVGVSTIFLFARVFTKHYVMKQVHAEDYFIVLGWMSEIAFETTAFLRLQCGMSCHQWDLTPATFECFKFRTYLSSVLYAPTMIFVKLSILCQLKRIFTTPTKGAIHWIIIALMSINTLFYGVFDIVEIFYCTPIQKSWIPSLPGTCQDIDKGLVFSPAVDLVLNCSMLCLPVWILWRLELKVEQKLRAAFIFAFATLACVSAALRVYFTVATQGVVDITYSYKGLAWSTALETGSGVIIASLPIMPRLLRWLRGQDITQNRFPGGPTKLRRLTTTTKTSYDPPFLIQHPGPMAGHPSDANRKWIPLGDRQPGESQLDEGGVVPTSNIKNHF